MLRLSKKGEYAVRALIEIGIRSQLVMVELVSVSSVAESTKIPEKFLEQILLILKNGGILKSKRGVDGGYALARSMESITMAEVVRIVDGPMCSLPCVEEGGRGSHSDCLCLDENSCGLKWMMQQARGTLFALLDGMTLQSIVSEVIQKRAKSDGLQFEI